MLNLQLGIRHAVGSLAVSLEASRAALADPDFASKVRLIFGLVSVIWRFMSVGFRAALLESDCASEASVVLCCALG